MKSFTLIIILIASICFACREIYEPKIEAKQNVLVVEGLLTDEAKSYSVKLSRAAQFDNTEYNQYVQNAKVSIHDDCGNVYMLNEANYGVYESNPAELIGQPGKSYLLHIETSDEKVYESTYQLLLPNNFDVTAYAEFSTQDKLVEDDYGGVSKVTLEGVDLLVDISNNSDTLPRFRFQTIVTTEYEYSVFRGPTFFCWKTSFPYDLVNLTNEKYQAPLSNIQKHKLGFIPTYYSYRTFDPNNNEVDAFVLNRIVKVDQYRINDETFQFYKNVNTLLSAQGKIFDPIAFKLSGNITCKTDPQENVLGFFEASSVRTSLFSIKPGKKIVDKVQGVNPPLLPDCKLNDPPNFWVY